MPEAEAKVVRTSKERIRKAKETAKALERSRWSKKRDYVLVSIGYTVGMSNFARLPQLVYIHGGGAFFIPYFISLLFLAIPLYCMEAALGQFASQGPAHIWKFFPLFRGLGVPNIAACTILPSFYAVTVAYTCVYMFSSLTIHLPWTTCGNWWNSNRSDEKPCSLTPVEVCTVNFTKFNQEKINQYLSQIKNNNSDTSFTGVGLTFNRVWKDEVIHAARFLNVSHGDLGCFEFSHIAEVSPAIEYWHNVVSVTADNIFSDYTFNSQLVFSMVIIWVSLFVCGKTGINATAKVSYFTATFPYFFLTAMIITGLTGEGAVDGLTYYIGLASNVEKLWDAKVWQAACQQTFLSVGISQGGIFTLASYNKFHNNPTRDSFAIPLIDTLSSIYAGCAVFIVIGNLAAKLKQPITDVVETGLSGYDLAFVTIPTAMSHWLYPALWCFLMFFMVFTLGFDVLFAYMEIPMTAALDMFPTRLKNKRWAVLLFMCSFLLLIGLFFCTKSGLLWIDVIDTYVLSFSWQVMALLQMIAINLYGVNRFIDDIELMIGNQKWYYWVFWKYCWMYITPVFVLINLALTCFELFTQNELSPLVVAVVCIIIMITLIIPVSVSFVYGLWKNKWSLREALKPDPDWGPLLKKNSDGTRYKYMKRPHQAHRKTLFVQMRELEEEAYWDKNIDAVQGVRASTSHSFPSTT